MTKIIGNRDNPGSGNETHKIESGMSAPRPQAVQEDCPAEQVVNVTGRPSERQTRILEELVRVLCDRFGQRTTLGETLTVLIAFHRLSRGETLSISDLANLSGQSTSSVSRWLDRMTNVRLVNDPNDERRKLIEIIDWEKPKPYMARVAAILGHSE